MRFIKKTGVIFLFFVFFAGVLPQTENEKVFTTNKSQTPLSTEDLEKKAEFYANQWSGESVRRSIDLYGELSEKYKAAGDLRRSAETAVKSVYNYLLLEEYEAAQTKLNEVLKTIQKADDENIRAEVFGLLSMVSLRNGKIKDSEKFLNKAFKVNSAGLKPTSKAAVHSAACEFKYLERQLPETIANCRQAVEMWRTGGNIRQEIQALRMLAYAYIADEELNAAYETLNLAIDKARENDLRREEALSQYQMGFYYLLVNEPQTALEVCRKAEILFPDDMDFVERARLTSGIGTIYQFYSDWKTAIVYKQKAYDLYEKGNYQIGKMATLPSLIKLSFLDGNEQSAFDYFRQAEILSAKLSDSFYIANARSYVGDFYNAEGDDKKAIEIYSKSLDALRKLHYFDGMSLVENNLGKIYLRRKNFELAENYFNSALNENRKIRNKLSESETLFNLAKLYFEQNNYEKALTFAADSVEITENLSAGVVNAKLKTTYFSNVYERYEFYINLLMEMHREKPSENYAVRALQISEKARARRMLENLSLSESNFIKDAPQEVVEREKEIRNLLNLKADNLSYLLSRGAEKSSIAEAESEIHALENELEEINARLKQNSPVYSSVKNPAPFQVADFQNRILDENTLLLEFSLGERASYLWKIGKNDFAAYTLPPRLLIEEKVRQLRELLAENEIRENETVESFQARISEAEKKYHQTAAELSRELFGQLAGELGNKRLVIAADGVLHYFPVAALPLPFAADEKPILLSNEIVYEPSASLLMMLRQNAADKSKPKEDLLVFADPVFSADDSRLTDDKESDKNLALNSVSRIRFSESLDSLSRLAASKEEADLIVNIVGKSNSDEFYGFNATRQKFMETNVSDYKILHFATHGLINEERPELSGIVLSRFDQNGNKLNESIRLQDIYGLNFNTDLVVLSACSTGIGKEVKGEGLMSLNNAFLQSGSKTVISSLWKVDDLATVELMKNFYQNMSDENVSASVALRQAQIKMWENPQYKSPFYWAAFTFQGDYQNKPEFTKSADYSKLFLILLSVLGLAGILAGYGLLRKKRASIN